MRIYLYLIAGITSALIGWNIGQFFLTDLGILTNLPELVLFPCVAIALATGMVLNEIFISNPTRPKLCLRKAKIPLAIAFGLGLVSGLVGGLISQIVLLPFISIPTWIVRTIGWLLIGLSVGLAEGFTWRFETVEAGDKKRFRQRFITSIVGGSIASLLAALLFELIRMQGQNLPDTFKMIEDPLGFSILGLFLGLTFSVTSSPSYLVALRAGAGFEFLGDTFYISQDAPKASSNQKKTYPAINKSSLKFVSNSDDEIIEEGLSIQLPAQGKFRIGSALDSHIYIPDIPLYVADLVLERRSASLIPTSRFYRNLLVNGDRLGTNRTISLKHNYLLTFFATDEENNINEEKFYRFVYYNRFLDPQA